MNRSRPIPEICTCFSLNCDSSGEVSYPHHNDSDSGSMLNSLLKIGLSKLTLIFPLYDMGHIIWPFAFQVLLSIPSYRLYYVAYMRMDELL